jgi:predicted Zn finger-like uncharacterized protein
MNTNIACPNCGQPLMVDSTTIGQQVRCPSCSTTFVVPVVGATPATARKSGMAITSMVLGITSVTCLGIFTGIPAIILGHISHGRARKSPDQYAGRGMAIAGFVMGYFSLVLTLVIVPALLLPALAAAKRQAQVIQRQAETVNSENNNSSDNDSQLKQSENNLKQIGLAFRIWEGDNGDQLPFNVSQSKGGVKELCKTGSDGFEKNPAAVFMVMSNELSTPRILVCPNDPQKQAAADFSSLTADNISYQLRTGPNINDSHPEEILAIDPINGLVLRCDGSVRKDLSYKK